MKRIVLLLMILACMPLIMGLGVSLWPGGGGAGGGTDSHIVHSTDGGTGVDAYTYDDLPDGGAAYRQNLKRTIPASGGNIRLGDVDIPWGYNFSCGPSPSSLLDDCTQGYYFNHTNISASTRINEFLPGYRSQAIENSFNADPNTGGTLWYEENESIMYPVIDVTIAGASGTWTPGDYVIINTWGGGTESWAQILTATGDVLRLSFQGTLATPALGNTVSEVNNPIDRTPGDASGTWPATWTTINTIVRTMQKEFGMTGSPSTWKWLVPTDMTAADYGQKTIMSVGKNTTFTGAQVNYSSATGNTGLSVGGTVLVVGESNASAPCDTYGCVNLRNAAGGFARVVPSNEIGVGITTNVFLPTTSGGNPMLAPIPRNHPRAGIGYAYQIGWIGGTHTGDAYCESAVRGTECSTVICHGEHGSAANGDDGHNSDCTASTAPWACCTGSGTGTCAAVMIEDCSTTLNPASGAHNSHWATIVCNESDTLP